MCVGAALLALRWLVGGRRLDGECTVFGMVEALHRREEGVAAERREVAASGLAQGSLRERLRAASVRGEAHAAAGGCTQSRSFMPKMASATATPGAIGSPLARTWLTPTATAPPTR